MSRLWTARLLEGEEVTNYELHAERVAEDDWDTWADLTVGADYFSCPNCRLVLDGYEVLTQADMDTEFSATGDAADYYEDNYGND
ncbi:MAG: hypothetical protein ABI047_07170 [Jatrophihabitantaceae bacterium]